jgi:hypothetical protein
MGYTIIIGNATPEFSKDDGDLYARWTVEGKELPDAPTFPHDEMTGNSNVRSPSYSGWADFCREAGLHDLFLLQHDGLMGEHPGCQMVKPSDLQFVQAALTKRKQTSTLPPGFSDVKFNKDSQSWENIDEGKYDAALARLLWLEFWMKWALENCETPAIQNT